MTKDNTTEIKGMYRYSKELNTVYIDIDIDFYREIYNEWDFSPITNSDLDDDLIEYLEDCASEISKKHQICIVFHIPSHIKDDLAEKKSIGGFYNYFNYRIKRRALKLKAIRKQSFLYFVSGVLFLLLATVISHTLPQAILTDFVIEGMAIGGWVLFWEMFNNIFFRSEEYKNKITIYKRLRDSQIQYSTDKRV